jgi:hypothetical protein
MSKLIQTLRDAMRIVRSWRGNGSERSGLAPERWAASTGGTMTTSMPDDNDLLICTLQHRVEELMADNDSMRSELWAKDVALRVLAEKIDDLEGEVK